MTPPLLLVQDLCFAYRQGAGGDAPAVGAISFALAPGEIVCILGPSGCGKTTLLNLNCRATGTDLRLNRVLERSK